MMDSNSLIYWCRRPESNRHGPYEPRDFKSLASTNSATPALLGKTIATLPSPPLCGKILTMFF